MSDKDKIVKADPFTVVMLERLAARLNAGELTLDELKSACSILQQTVHLTDKRA